MRNLGFDAAAGASSMAGVERCPRGANGLPIAGVYTQRSVCSVSGEPRLWAVDLAGWMRQSNTSLTRCTATITYGSGGDGGGAVEVVELDWPQAGTTVFVHARDVRVEANYTVAQLDITGQRFPPDLSAWITPGIGSQRPMTATLTTPIVVAGIGATTPFLVPERARAYRLMPVGALGTLDLVVGSQQTNNATPVTVGGDTLGEAPIVGQYTTWTQPTNRATWYPLHPRASVVNVSTTAVVLEYSLQWLLELG